MLRSYNSPSPPASSPLGIHPRWYKQLCMLALNLISCGGIVGLSRLLPQLAEEKFQMHSFTAILFFIVTFGFSKAIFNLLVGTLANIYGRRLLLLVGWSMSFLTPLLIWFATSWSWIIASTAVLGASQGLCTSTVVVMVMDVVPKRARGISMGVLECSIYVSLGLAALFATELLARFQNDFQAVLVAHGILCCTGLIAAFQTKETQSLAMSERELNNDSPSPIGHQIQQQQQHQHRSPKDSESESDEENSQRKNGNSSFHLQWNSLRQDHNDLSDKVSPIALSQIHVVGTNHHEISNGMNGSTSHNSEATTLLQQHLPASTSILPTLSLHSIPASPATPSLSNGFSDIAAIETMVGAVPMNETNTTGTSANTFTSIANMDSSDAVMSPVTTLGEAEASLQPRKSVSASPVVSRKFSLSSSAAAAASSSSADSTPTTLSASNSREDLSLLTSRLRTDSPFQASRSAQHLTGSSSSAGGGESFWRSFRASLNRTFSSSVLRAIVQAGFTNNFRDGIAWGLLPSFFSLNSSQPAGPAQLGYLLTIYPLVWGIGQLATGRLSDTYGRVNFIVGGLLLQGMAMFGLVATPPVVSYCVPTLLKWIYGSSLPVVSSADSAVDYTAAVTVASALEHEYSTQLFMELRFVFWMLNLVALGLGTALSYPVLQAYIGDYVSPIHRASTIGVYRLCRDSGYAIGGLLSGILADLYGVEACLTMMACLLMVSATYAHLCLPKDQEAGSKKRKYDLK